MKSTKIAKKWYEEVKNGLSIGGTIDSFGWDVYYDDDTPTTPIEISFGVNNGLSAVATSNGTTYDDDMYNTKWEALLSHIAETEGPEADMEAIEKDLRTLIDGENCFFAEDEIFVINGEQSQIRCACVFENGVVVDYDATPLQTVDFDVEKTNAIWEERGDGPLDSAEWSHRGEVVVNGSKYDLRTIEI